LDLFYNNFEIFDPIRLPNNDTLFEVNKTYDIKKEGLYSIYFGFCSTTDDYSPQKEVNFNDSLRIIYSSISMKNSDVGHLSAENYLKLKVIYL